MSIVPDQYGKFCTELSKLSVTKYNGSMIPVFQEWVQYGMIPCRLGHLQYCLCGKDDIGSTEVYLYRNVKNGKKIQVGCRCNKHFDAVDGPSKSIDEYERDGFVVSDDEEEEDLDISQLSDFSDSESSWSDDSN